jgi:Transposase DDE domain
LHDAVATQDTVTQVRAAIGKLLMAADRDAPTLAAAVRAALARDDDYATVGKPPSDWDDDAAREALVDALVPDAVAALRVLDGRQLAGPVAEAADLLAVIAGQDVEQGEEGTFPIARKVARDRGDLHCGHPSAARAQVEGADLDGYKTHLGVDPDDELITNVTVTPANTADRDVIDDLLDEPTDTTGAGNDAAAGEPNADRGKRAAGLEVYGDSAYAGGQTLAEQACRGNDLRAKVPPVRNAHGYSKDQFVIDPEAARRVHQVPLRAGDQHPPP